MYNQRNSNSTIRKNLIGILIFLCLTTSADAASLSITPSSVSVATDNIFTVRVVTNTLGKSINNAEAILQFPKDVVEVVSVSKSTSIFSLWVEDPTYSNAAGTVSFNGGLASPGYNGTSGTIVSITFKAKKPGAASLILSDAAVRENDGLGTDILSSKGSASVQITTDKAPAPTVPSDEGTVQKVVTQSKPIVSSETHPDQERWYSSSTASFNWKAPNGVTAIQAQTTKSPAFIPTISYDSSVTQKTLTDISDGTFYFNIRYKNAGVWGPIAQYKIHIDTTPPEPFVPTITLGNSTSIKLDAQDKTSGIDRYMISIDGAKDIVVSQKDITSDEYILPPQQEGEHNVDVVVYDKAGNYRETRTIFTAPAIDIPTISLSNTAITKNESIVVTGTSTYPGKQVEIIVEQNGKTIASYVQSIATDGSFSVTTDAIKTVGMLDISARNVLDTSVKSLPTNKLYLTVANTETQKLSLSLIRTIGVAVLLFILLTSLYVGWHKFFGLKKKIRNELKQTVNHVHKAMMLLRDQLNEQLVVLEKIKDDRPLNKKEKAVFSEMKKRIDNIDDFIDKKLTDLL